MIKYRQFVFLLILLAFARPKGYSQLFKGEIIAGCNKSQVDGDEAYRFKKYGLVGGVGVVAPITKNWSLSLETLYSQKGSKLKRSSIDSLDGSYKLLLNYAEVPFMIQYTDRDIASVGIGASWGRLVFAEEFKNGYKVDSVSILSKVFDHNDWMAFADVRVRLYKNLIINARYSYSIDKIATRVIQDSQTGRPNERDFYNNLWSFRLIYMINEKRPEKSAPKADPLNE